MKGKFLWLMVVIDLILFFVVINNPSTTSTSSGQASSGSPLDEKEISKQEPIEYIPELPTPTSIPKSSVTITPVPTVIKKIVTPVKKQIIDDGEPWGVAKQIGEVTWTMKIGEDERMATPREIHDALNEYRKVHASQILTWDEKLANYAQQRAQYLNSIKSVDQHKGFKNFLENEDGFNKLGFTSLGENISFGYKLNGVHTIEWMYAGDKPHNDNQLNTKWDHVGIGVDGLATCLIFATGKF